MSRDLTDLYFIRVMANVLTEASELKSDVKNSVKQNTSAWTKIGNKNSCEACSISKTLPENATVSRRLIYRLICTLLSAVCSNILF